MSGEGSEGGVLTRNRVSAEQLDLLLSFMEEHVDFAAGKQSIYSRFSASKLWRLLAERLNAAAADSGGARKSPDKWCRYWADIKYKARKKCAAGGALGDLSSAEERLRGLLQAPRDDDERKPALDDDRCSSGSAAPDARLQADDLLAEAAMRQALAAEKQAEAVTQGVELLRELVGLVREHVAVGATAGLGAHAAHGTHGTHGTHAAHAHDHSLAGLQHHHHRL